MLPFPRDLLPAQPQEEKKGWPGNAESDRERKKRRIVLETDTNREPGRSPDEDEGQEYECAKR